VEKDVTLQVRITSRLRGAIDKAAEGSGHTRSSWVIAVLARAVDKGAYGNWTPDAPGGQHGKRKSKA
jgi:hypothetical protein